MKTIIHHHKETIEVDLSKPLDISLPLRGNEDNPVAWYQGPPRVEAVRDGDWVGKVSHGASTNFNNIFFNPHAHGTHTECVGHISGDFYSINSALKTFFFSAKVISMTPVKKGEDRILTKDELEGLLGKEESEALVIRTLPNDHSKRSRKYSHTNWPYLEEAAAKYIRECGIEHLLIDLPSVDKEKDQGKLLAHKAFWNYPEETRFHATITEMIFVPNLIPDGRYFLNLQMASFENDAAPSKPVLYAIDLRTQS